MRNTELEAGKLFCPMCKALALEKGIYFKGLIRQIKNSKKICDYCRRISFPPVVLLSADSVKKKSYRNKWVS